MGRRRRRWREPAFVWWTAFGALIVIAGLMASWRILLLVLALWCLYEFCMAPCFCGVVTREGAACRGHVRGRLFACEPDHQQVKNEILLRATRLRRTRRPTTPDPSRETGVVVFSPSVRGRLEHQDRTLLVLAAFGTLVTVAGMVYGLTAA